MVEFGGCIIFLVLLTMGLIQYGIIVNTENVIKHVARDGARNAGLYANDANRWNTISAGMHNACAGTMVNYSDLVITGLPTATTEGHYVTGSQITLTVSYNMRSPTTNKFFLPTSFPGLGNINPIYSIRASAMVEST